MKIVIDKRIPFVNGVFEPYAQVSYLDGLEISNENLKDVNALMIRSRTRCDDKLLHDTPVQIISTTTPGREHIDMEWCESNGIYVNSSVGCNSSAVADYVFSAIYGIAARKGYNLECMSIGIIGGGATASRVAQMGRRLGFKTIVCDPLHQAGGSMVVTEDLNFLLRNSDIVSMHIPLNEQTRDMANANFFSQMKLDAMFINASHGELVVEEDLLESTSKLGPIVIDTWRNEPHINLDLLNVATIATPNIAGYSYQGKMIGSQMAVRAIARFFGISELFEFCPTPEVEGLEAVKLDIRGRTQGQITSDIQYNYPIFTDDFLFRIDPSNFNELRRKYRYRREFFID